MTATVVGRPTAVDIAELVRLPAVLSVPGDVIVGAAMAAPDRLPRQTAVLACASCLIYLGGMALNDVADAEVDAAERPHRPIPSGRVSRRDAARIGHGLLLSGVALAGVTDRRALRIAAPLGAAVYAYDLALKNTRGAPVAMALCRTLDVLLGATAGRLRDAIPAATAIGAHTVVVTTISRRETEGATSRFAGTATGLGGLATGLVAAVVRHGRHRDDRRLAAVPLLAHAALQARDGVRAVAEPTPGHLQRLVGTGVLGMLPQQSALALSRGHRAVGGVLAALWPVARRLARRRSVT